MLNIYILRGEGENMTTNNTRIKTSMEKKRKNGKKEIESAMKWMKKVTRTQNKTDKKENSKRKK